MNEDEPKSASAAQPAQSHRQPQPQSPARVAMIVVHGVANQEEFATPREIIEQLQHNSASLDSPVKYSAFIEQPVTVPVVWPGDASESPRSCWENAKLALAKFPLDWTRRYTPDATDPEDALVMDGQLRYLRASELDPAYRTTVASGERTEAGRTTRVDVYEMYWADLSRLGSGIGRFLREFYQLLFHLPWLGWGTVDALSRQFDGRGTRSRWRALDVAYRVFGYLLSVHVPLINVFLLCLVLMAAVFTLPEHWRTLIAVVGAGVGAFAACSLGLFRAGFALTWIDWIAAACVALFCGALVHLLSVDRAIPQADDLVLVAECAGLLALGTAWLVRMYGAAQPCAVPAGWMYFLILAAALVCGATIYAASPVVALDGIVFGAIVFFLLLGLASAVLFALALAIASLSSLQWARHGRGEGRDQHDVRRGLWTGLIAAAIPLAIFTFITASLWVGLTSQVTQRMPETIRALDVPGAFVTSSQVMTDLVRFAAAPISNAFTILIVLAAVASLWFFAPSALSDVTPPRDERDPGAVARYGNRLDQTFRSLRLAGLLTIVATMLILPVAFFHTSLGVGWAVLDTVWEAGRLDGAVARSAVESIVLAAGALGDPSQACTVLSWHTLLPCLNSHSLVIWTGGVLVVLLGVMIAFKQVAEQVLRGLSTVLDIALDVDNYIRKYPKTRTLRAQLITRFVSLLRHVSARGRERPYDAIVVVAHSQGTVIAVETLRLLERIKAGIEGKGRVNPIFPVHPLAGVRVPPILLATFGSPLRQLYLQRFPSLYRFVDAPVGGAAWAQGEPPAPARGPDPGALLNVHLWVNGFRSADYVGRNLWQLDGAPMSWTPGQTLRTAESGRVWTDVCVGAGAHNRYFHKSARTVAQLIDALVSRVR